MIEQRYWDPPLDFIKEEVNELEENVDISLVLNFLHKNLEADWEFYFRPDLDGLQPDLILLHEKVGIQIVHVLREKVKIKFQYARLQNLKNEILDFYIPKSIFPDFKSIPITLCLACPFLPKEELIKKVVEWKGKKIESQLMPWEEYSKGDQILGLSHNFSVITSETLKKNNIKGAVPLSTQDSSEYMDEKLARFIRAHIITSDYKLEDLEPIFIKDLDENQRKLVLTRSSEGHRTIRGSSGSGKSLILAGKAMQLHKEGKSVIVFTFNKTLPNLLKHYFRRFLKGDDEYDLLLKPSGKTRRSNAPIFIHFTRYMKRQFRLKGEGETWSKIFDFKERRPVHAKISQMCEIFEKMTGLKKFDAVIVDEGQDFKPEWWRACKSLLKEGGEVYFAIDNSQDIYKRKDLWNEGEKKVSGLVGRPTILTTSYRLPKSYIRYIREYFVSHIEPEHLLDSDVDINIPEVSPQLELSGIESCYLSWEQLNEQKGEELGVDRCVSFILNNLPNLVDKFAYSNLTLLTTYIKSGRSIVEKLEQNNLKVTHTFSQDSTEENSQKLSFDLSENKIKATTVRSFKGFEAPLILYLLEKKSSAKEVYTALTRLRMGHQNTCHIKVVSTNPTYSRYGASWTSQSNQEWLKI